MNLIAFCGGPGAGKTESAQYLASHYGYTPRSFAAELKRICAWRCEADWQEHLYEWCEARLVPLYGYPRMYELYETLRAAMSKNRWQRGGKNRAMLQAVGNGARCVVKNVWVDLALADLPERCVFDDVRFLNEYDALIAKGFTVYRITAPITARLDRLRRRDGAVDEAALAAPMEQGLPGVDVVEFANEGSVADLRGWCDALVNPS